MELAFLGSGAARLHAKGHRGKGTRLAIVDSDFRGWEAVVGDGLPAKTTLLDLTAAIRLLPKDRGLLELPAGR